VPEGSATAKAIDYSLNRWAALSTYLADANVQIDNNWIENLVRPWAMGRNHVNCPFMRIRRMCDRTNPVSHRGVRRSRAKVKFA
jgi:hypothetical protein